MIIDGLGYEFLAKHKENSFLYKHCVRKITSVFPPTTAAALTVFNTGVAPQQHALTGWFMYFKEIGIVSAVLPFISRAGKFKLNEGGIAYDDIFDSRTFYEGLGTFSYQLLSEKYYNSAHSFALGKGAKIIPFSNLDDLFRKIDRTAKAKGRKFISAYWDQLDALSHTEGTGSPKTIKHLWELDRKISKLSKSLENTDTTIIVTADHGLINCGKNKTIDLKDYPEFQDMLVMPLTGDARTVYCYVRPNKTKQFEKYAKTKLRKFCEIYKSGDLIKKGFFGLYKPHKKLKDRVGDYTIIMKKNYVIQDHVPGVKKKDHIGRHGGVSKEEMYVPLIVI
jgi:predicted AlkP superfamily pyrophosphatase or phosphodiesterase